MAGRARGGSVLHDRALRVAQAAVDRRDEEAELAIGHVYFEMGDYERALEWYEQTAVHSDLVELWRAMARALMAMGDYGEARAALYSAIRLSKWVRVEDLRQLAECLRHLGNDRAADEAEQLAQQRTEATVTLDEAMPLEQSQRAQ